MILLLDYRVVRWCKKMEVEVVEKEKEKKVSRS